MTCIVGMIENGKAHFGADSASVDSPGDFIEQWKTPKIFKKGDFIIGFAGLYSVGQIVRLSLVLPKIDDMEIEEYLVSKFIPALKKILLKENIKDDDDWVLLIGYKDRLFVLGDDYSVGEPSEGFTAMGTGRNLALGSLNTSYYSGLVIKNVKTVEDYLQLALETASKYCQTVNGPFAFIST